MSIDIEAIKKRRKEAEVAEAKIREGEAEAIRTRIRSLQKEIKDLQAMLGEEDLSVTSVVKKIANRDWTGHTRIYQHPKDRWVWWNGKGKPKKKFLDTLKKEKAKLEDWVNEKYRHIYETDEDIVKKL